MFYPTSPWTRARVKQHNWSTLRALVHDPVYPGRAGRPHGPSDTSTSSPGLVVDSVVPWTRALVGRDRVLNPRGFEPEPESPGCGGRHRRPSDPIASRPGELVNTTCLRTWAVVTLDSWSTPWDLTHGPECESTRSDGRQCGPSDKGASRPGQLINNAGPQTLARGIGTDGRLRRPSDPSPSLPGVLVDPVGPQTGSQVARDSRSKPRALGPGRESSGTAGGILGNSNMGTSHPRQLVDPAVPWKRA